MRVFMAIFFAFFASINSSHAASDRVCAAVEELARLHMELRQRGVPLAEMIKLDDQAKNDSVRQISRKLSMAAYEQPLYSTPEIKDRVTKEFASKHYLQCLKE